MSNWQPSKSDKSERLLHLTCALLAAPYPLTKDEIYSAIKGYRDSIDQGTDRRSVDRMFERDKDDLRQSGIQVATHIPAHEMDNNTETRYFIAEETFIWPKQVELSQRQLKLLELAAQAWAQASLSADANRALNRLRALGLPTDTSGLVGIAPRIRTHEPSFWPLNEAIELGRMVSFSYRKPGSNQAEKRNVVPWSLQNIDGQWLLISYDLDREDARNFLLKRIVSKVVISEEEYERPPQSNIDAVLAELEEHTNRQVARLRVKPDSEAWFHFELDLPGATTDGEFEIRFQDMHLLAEELREYGSDVKVVRPVELANAIRAGFEKVASDHA